MRNPNTNCNHCGKPIYRRPAQLSGRVYCSKVCYGKATRKEVPCVICGAPILASLHKKTCSKECWKKSFESAKRNHALGRRPITSNEPRYGSRSFYKKFREVRGNACEKCGYDDEPRILQAHHIVHRSEGGGDEWENLLLTCPNCHAMEHLPASLDEAPIS